MTNEHWTDDRLDQAIDASARRMTAGSPRPGLAARVAARLEHRRPLLGVLRFAAAAALIVLVVFAGTRLWRPPIRQLEPRTRFATSTASRGHATVPQPGTPTAQRQRLVTASTERRPPQRITIDRRANDIPALDAPTALSVGAADVAELSIAPIEVPELSVSPLVPDTSDRPR